MVGERMETWTFAEERPEDEEIRKLGRGSVSTGATGPADIDISDHQTVIENMRDCVHGEAEPIVPATSARVTLEMALAMYKSAATGQWTSLPVTDEESIWT
jgi:predicted dehydrogenase